MTGLVQYMWHHYGQHGFPAKTDVEGFNPSICCSGEHTQVYAYNLCKCLDCNANPKPPPQPCTAKRACEGGWYGARVRMTTLSTPFRWTAMPSPRVIPLMVAARKSRSKRTWESYLYDPSMLTSLFFFAWLQRCKIASSVIVFSLLTLTLLYMACANLLTNPQEAVTAGQLGQLWVL